ncbi:hypothetical protein D3C85_1430320 [compost metagenome]
MQGDQSKDDPFVELVPGRHGIGGDFADVSEQRALRHDVVGREQAADCLEPHDQQQGHDRQCAQRIVAGGGGRALEVAGHCRGATHKVRESGVARAEEAP